MFFLLTTAAGAVLFLLKNDLAVHWAANFKAKYLLHHPRSRAQVGEFLYIALNDLRVSFLVCLLGLVPFFVPAVLGLVINTTLLAWSLWPG